MIVALTFWLFWRFFAAQFRHAVEHQADWGHTLIIPLIAGGILVYGVHRQTGSVSPRTSLGS
ncbi:MAG: hypothetical protein IH933_14375 [Euryarchaeota archaeon]|nr:hypothetical protein [Euryarchaeota archaeon]